MNFETAIKALGQLHNAIGLGYDWKWLDLARRISADEGSATDSVWLNGNDQFSWLKTPDIQKESSYSECVRGSLYTLDAHNLVLEVEISDGDLLTGYPIKRRCRFSVTFDKMYAQLERPISQALRNRAKYLIEQEDKAAMELRIQSTINNLLL